MLSRATILVEPLRQPWTTYLAPTGHAALSYFPPHMHDMDQDVGLL